MIKINNELPKVVGTVNPKFTEYLHYQYLPIKLNTSLNMAIEPRLRFLQYFISICIDDHIDNIGTYYHKYIYLTVKHMYQKPNCGFNRNGWHIDGFLTDDINYIFYSSQPTVFNHGHFSLSEDHDLALEEMQDQADPIFNIRYENNTILRLNSKVVHKVAPTEEGVRSFIKLTFSRDKFNLEGNSHNYELDYDWEMFPRKKERNHPSVWCR